MLHLKQKLSASNTVCVPVVSACVWGRFSRCSPAAETRSRWSAASGTRSPIRHHPRGPACSDDNCTLHAPGTAGGRRNTTHSYFYTRRCQGTYDELYSVTSPWRPPRWGRSGVRADCAGSHLYTARLGSGRRWLVGNAADRRARRASCAAPGFGRTHYIIL